MDRKLFIKRFAGLTGGAVSLGWAAILTPVSIPVRGNPSPVPAAPEYIASTDSYAKPGIGGKPFKVIANRAWLVRGDMITFDYKQKYVIMNVGMDYTEAVLLSDQNHEIVYLYSSRDSNHNTPWAHRIASVFIEQP